MDEVKEPCPLPVREARAQCAAHSFGFYIGLAVRDQCKRIRAIRIDAELFCQRASFGQLHRSEAKIAAATTFAHETAAARA